MSIKWTESSFHDAIGAQMGARRVLLRRLIPNEPPSDENPLVPQIFPNSLIVGVATLLLARDVQGRLEAEVSSDHSPEANGGKIGWARAHEVYAMTRPNAAYDIPAVLALIEAGQHAKVFVPSNCRIPALGLWGAELGNLRGGYSSSSERPTVPYETPPDVKAIGKRLYAAALAQCVADVAIDADLAAENSAHLAAVRADFLAAAQTMYPARGYT